MKKLLVPTDFSDNAANALKYAASLAHGMHAEIVLMHAMHIPVIDGSTPVDASSEMLEEQRKASADKLAALAQGIKEDYGVETTWMSDFAFAVDLICRSARSEEVDFICMGTKGASNIFEQLLGSVTAEVIRKSTRPVLAVPSHAHFEEPGRLAFATDLEDNDAEEIKTFYGLFEEFDPSLFIVHVEVNEKLGALPGHHSVHKVVDSYDNIERVEIKSDDVEHGLEDYVEREHIQILGMKRQNRGFFQNMFHRSMTKQLAYHTKIPLMVFHEV